MNLAESLRGLLRRWYITVPGIVLAVAVAVGIWFAVPPENQRSASLLLVPGQGSLPAKASNPYLYLAGLATATDVVARAAGAEDSLAEILDDHPDAEVTLERDGSTSGPIILVKVTTTTDAETAAVLEQVIDHTVETLDTLQSDEGIQSRNRITMVTLSADDESTLQQRTRITIAGGAAAVVLLLSFVLAALVDGLARRRPRSEVWGAAEDDPRDGPDTEPDVGMAEADYPVADMSIDELDEREWLVSFQPQRDAETARGAHQRSGW